MFFGGVIVLFGFVAMDFALLWGRGLSERTFAFFDESYVYDVTPLPVFYCAVVVVHNLSYCTSIFHITYSAVQQHDNIVTPPPIHPSSPSRDGLIVFGCHCIVLALPFIDRE